MIVQIVAKAIDLIFKAKKDDPSFDEKNYRFLVKYEILKEMDEEAEKGGFFSKMIPKPLVRLYGIRIFPMVVSDDDIMLVKVTKIERI